MSPNWYEAAFRFLGGVPENYLVFDCETQGPSPTSHETLVTQFGYVLVENNQVVAMDSLILDWTRSPEVDPEWFRASLQETRDAMARKGKPYQTSWERIQREGVDPLFVIEEARALLEDASQQDYALVAHNGFAFDTPLLQRHFQYLERPFVIPSRLLVDTGMLEKARQMGWSPPHPGECLRADWYDQIQRTRSRVRWALDGACSEEYGLLDGSIDSAMAHDAAVDCLLTHRLLEKMAERSREPVLV